MTKNDQRVLLPHAGANDENEYESDPSLNDQHSMMGLIPSGKGPELEKTSQHNILYNILSQFTKNSGENRTRSAGTTEEAPNGTRTNRINLTAREGGSTFIIR